MGEDLGTKLQGSTTFKKLFRSTLGPTDIVPVSLAGGTAATYLMGSALIDDSTTGLKKKYTNGGAVTGACVLMRDEATTATGGNVQTDGARDGSVDTTMVLDISGRAVDAAFKAALPKMMFD